MGCVVGVAVVGMGVRNLFRRAGDIELEEGRREGEGGLGGKGGDASHQSM